MKHASHNPNRSLVRIFCLSLGGLLFVYTAIAIYSLMMRPDVGAAEFAIALVRIAFAFPPSRKTEQCICDDANDDRKNHRHHNDDDDSKIENRACLRRLRVENFYNVRN